MNLKNNGLRSVAVGFAIVIFVLVAATASVIPGFAFAADLGDGDEVYGVGGMWNETQDLDNGYWNETQDLDNAYWNETQDLENEYWNESQDLENEYWNETQDLDNDYGCDDCYGGGYSTGGGYSIGGGYGVSSGCGYFCGSGGGSYTTPGCTGCGGTTYKPTTQGGSQSQTQSQTSTNTNTNININNNTAIAVAQVQIPAGYSYQAPQYPSYQAPFCTINQAQASYTNYGTNQVYLSWNSQNAASAYLSNYGSVAVNGSQTFYTSVAQTFTLTVYGYNGERATCQTTVYANSAPYVSLTQIPYTGFDFGPIGNAMYWAGLAILALGGAYLTVYLLPQMAFAGMNKRSFAPVVAPKAPILVEKEAALEKVAPIVAALQKAGTTDAMAIVHIKGSMPRIVVDRS